MGGHMARNLCKAGHSVHVWNRTLEKAGQLEKYGAHVCTSPEQAVKESNVVILMVSNATVCDSLLFGTGVDVNPLSLGQDHFVVVMSSIPVTSARLQSERLKRWKTRYIDAPVSGGEHGAAEGKLTIMAGGFKEDIEYARPVFEAMGTLTHIGPTGCGQIAKIANQLIVGITIGAVSEALILAEKSGANASVVRTALFGGFADSSILRQHGLRMVNRDYNPGGHAKTQLKDLIAANELALECGIQLPLLSVITKLYEGMCEHSFSELDHSALYLYLKKQVIEISE